MAGKRVGEFKTLKSKTIFVDGNKKSNVIIKKVKNLRNGTRKNSSIEIIENTDSKAVCPGLKNDVKKKITVIETKNLQSSKLDVKRKKSGSEPAGKGSARESFVSEINDNKDSCNSDVSMHDRDKEDKNIVISDQDSSDCSGRDGAKRSLAVEYVYSKDSDNVDAVTSYRGRDSIDSIMDDGRKSNTKRTPVLEIKCDQTSHIGDVAMNHGGKDAKNSVTDDGRRRNTKRVLVIKTEGEQTSCNGDVAMFYKEKNVKDDVTNAGEVSKREVRRMKFKGSEVDDEATSDSDKSICERESIDCEGAAACYKKDRALLPEATNATDIKIVKSKGKMQNCKVASKAKMSQSEGQEVVSRKKATKRRNCTKVEENSMKCSKNNETSSASTTQMQRRILANARERTRVHKLSEAFDLLRSSIPSYTADQKLSKLSILRIAISYISALGCLVDCEKSKKAKQMFAVSVDNCTLALQSEFGRAKGARRPKNTTELDDESTKDS